MDSVNVFAHAARLCSAGVNFAITSIVQARGSTPRASARMLVEENGTCIGTIGGGLLESMVVKDALECIKHGTSAVKTYVLTSCSSTNESPIQEAGPYSDTARLDMNCGGTVDIAIDVVAGRRQLVIIGAGHVGLALANLADMTGFSVVVVDERPALASKERFPMAAAIYSNADLVKAIHQVPEQEGQIVVIATHSEDERALRTMVSRKWAYLGMLGSRRKVKLLLEKLAGEGVPAEILAKVHAPIGLDIGSETPEEIAVSIIAEIMKTASGTSGLSLSEKETV